jgi:hypothetical protein
MVEVILSKLFKKSVLERGRHPATFFVIATGDLEYSSNEGYNLIDKDEFCRFLIEKYGVGEYLIQVSLPAPRPNPKRRHGFEPEERQRKPKFVLKTALHIKFKRISPTQIKRHLKEDNWREFISGRPRLKSYEGSPFYREYFQEMT